MTPQSCRGSRKPKRIRAGNEPRKQRFRGFFVRGQVKRLCFFLLLLFLLLLLVLSLEKEQEKEKEKEHAVISQS